MSSERPGPPTVDAAVLHALTVAAADAAGQDYPASTLYVVATPIGNRADIGVRALACLARVDAVAAEDTRTALALLRHYGIDKPMIAAHRHNENAVASTIVARIAAGERIAYVSDAGTPGVSDPGSRLVAAVRDAGHRVMPLPGASALTTTLSAAGLDDGPVLFVGFLPSKAAQAATALRAFADMPAHLVFYEAPHRIVDTLTLVATACAGRQCVVARELTKRFETIHRGLVDDAPAWIAADADRRRGEFVVVVERLPDDRRDARALESALPILARLGASLSLSEAASLASELTGVPRKALYAHALANRRDDGDDDGREDTQDDRTRDADGDDGEDDARDRVDDGRGDRDRDRNDGDD